MWKVHTKSYKHKQGKYRTWGNGFKLSEGRFAIDIKETFFHNEAQAAQRSCACSIHENIQGQLGKDPQQPDLVKDVLVHFKGPFPPKVSWCCSEPSALWAVPGLLGAAGLSLRHKELCTPARLRRAQCCTAGLPSPLPPLDPAPAPHSLEQTPKANAGMCGTGVLNESSEVCGRQKIHTDSKQI